MSNNKLRRAHFSVNELVNKVQEYSHASKADMRHMLHRCMKDLHELGFKIEHINGLKPKHIYALVEHWKSQNKNPATIKNYMSKLRKTADLLNSPKLVKAGNDTYSIPRRSYASIQNKAIHNIDLNTCTDPHIRLSLEAQALFGLRREESMKLVISEAWQGKYLIIKPSWTKGGIGRRLPITNKEQQEWLIRASQLIKPKESLIPQDKSYKQHLRHYQRETADMGICKLHGLRHAFAQRRYREWTMSLDPKGKGLNCPKDGGKPANQLTSVERKWDKMARTQVSRELGHSRTSITKIYCG